MKQTFFTTAQLAALNCKAEDDAAAVETAFNNLVAKAAKVDTLTNDLTAANTAKQAAEDALNALKKTTVETQVKELLAGALTDKKITKAVSDELAVSYAAKPVELKKLIDAMPKYVSISDKINEGGNDDRIKALSAKSYSELDKAGLLEELKSIAPDEFKAKFKEQYKKDYTGK